MDSGFDDDIVEGMSHGVGTWSMFVRNSPCIEHFVKISLIGYSRIDDVSVQKNSAVDSQVVFMPLELWVGQRQLFELLGEGRQCVVVPQDVVELAIGVHRDEALEPADTFLDGSFVGVQGAPTEVEDVSAEDEGTGLCDGRFDGALDFGPGTSAGEQVQVGNEMGFGQLHGIAVTGTKQHRVEIYSRNNERGEERNAKALRRKDARKKGRKEERG